MSCQNEALRDECEALNAIYGDGTVELSASTPEQPTAIVKLPDVPFSFLLAFPGDYPDAPPTIRGTNSTGTSGRGEGERAVAILLDALSQVYTPGSVCLFDLIEEAAPRLKQYDHGASQDSSANETANRSDNMTHDNSSELALTTDPASSASAPSWALSEPMVVNKSTFVARALEVSSMTDVTNAVSHLISTNKRVATATHNIKAWRIKQDNGAGTVQDYDDDGETAAGGRLLHLMQLMDISDVLVVVTRWYGGVKLGPDRFRVINNVAREALTTGGFVDEAKSKSKKNKK